MKTKRVAIAYIKNDKDLLLMGKRKDNNKWSVPGGHLEESECPFSGVAREIKEETGLDAKDIKLVRAGIENNRMIYLFEVKIDKEQQINIKNDPDEEFEEIGFHDIANHISELHVPAKRNWVLKHWLEG